MPEVTATEHHFQTPRTARFWTLGDEWRSETSSVWVVLHGYRQLARRFLRRFQAIATPGRMIVAPEGLSRFYVDPSEGEHGPSSRVGATWMTREDRLHEIQDYVGYLDRLAAHLGWEDREIRRGIARPTVTILGFSQGAHTATRWAALGGTRIDRVILWGAGLPRDLEVGAHRDRLCAMAFTLVRGEQDLYHAEASQRSDAEALSSAAVPVDLRTHPGGHEVQPGLLTELAAVDELGRA